MPRPSLKDERSEQILDAYLTCVARFGLEGATQQRIATEAGIKRPLLRHYLGNRDQMLTALTAYVVDGFAVTTDALSEALTEDGTPRDLIELLFDDATGNDPRMMLAYQALVTATGDHPEMRVPLLNSMTRFLAVIENVLTRAAPTATRAHIRAVTQGIAASYVTLDAMSPLTPPAEWQSEMKQAAAMLAASLESEQ
ncbi:TetR/AcrR family transcriptional regulator [Aliiroseovarius lamellibrachiae]|uniref:TetR/AcrR family transcriptional regulator n=1 Tax=Aliiroseovarius lamellibrachiae TaxID=1924933 RepID=UPI001BE0045F|nr:TetR/AcrR family transcriptional regulator [Aliiroseovarius lamellibrachiae]MBT2132298.1 TetR family transcriptional regulator [Aliiroseovarius lamellibrachiae]